MAAIVRWIFAIGVPVLVACASALADDENDATYASLEPTLAKCINSPEAQCDFSHYPAVAVFKCIDDPSSLCNNWTGAKISADERESRVMAAEDDVVYASIEPTLAKCINSPEAQCDFAEFVSKTLVRCIDDPSSLCNNWTGAKISADERAERVMAAKAGKKSPNLAQALQRKEGNLDHCKNIFLDGFLDLRDVTKEWLADSQADVSSFYHIETKVWFNLVSDGVSRAKMRFRAHDFFEKPFIGSAVADIKNSDCSVVSFEIGSIVYI